MEFENNYELTEKDKERVGNTLKSIANQEITIGEYRSGVINMLNDREQTYMHYFANREQAIACEVSYCCSMCNKYMHCKGCPLDSAWRFAREEIYLKKRKPRKYTRRRNCGTTIWVNPKNGRIHIIQTM